MTRKDYKLIASRINDLRDDVYREPSASICHFDRFVSGLCRDLQQDNPDFDSAKFRDAVYK